MDNIYADSAKQSLQNSMGQCVSLLISEIQQQGESFNNWYDEILELGSVTEVADNQYRISNDGNEYHIIPVESLEQDDEDVEPKISITHEALRGFVDELSYNLYDTQDELIEYLKANTSWWDKHCTLLDEGDEPATEDCEVFEHWLVDNYAMTQLRSVDEKVVELFDLNVWCRTTTGQSFWYDSCMTKLGKRYHEERLADELRYATAK